MPNRPNQSFPTIDSRVAGWDFGSGSARPNNHNCLLMCMSNLRIPTSLLREAFDLIVPPAEGVTAGERWAALSEHIGRGGTWVRKTYRSGQEFIDVKDESVRRVMTALEALEHSNEDSAKTVIDSLGNILEPPLPLLEESSVRIESRKSTVGLNIGFIRSGHANYAKRLQMGFSWGARETLGGTHLINDESTVVPIDADPAQQKEVVVELIKRFELEARYIARSFIVPVGTQAAMTLCKVLGEGDWKLGKDFSVIYLGVTDPTQALDCLSDNENIAGMRYGIDGAERIRFITKLFPDKPIAYLYDSRAPQDLIVKEQIESAEYDPSLNISYCEVDPEKEDRLPSEAENKLVAGYYYLNNKLGVLSRKYKETDTAFIGLNITDLTRGAVASTGNDDVAAGRDCSKRLLAPAVRGELELHEKPVLDPPPVYGLNHKACQNRGLKTAKEGRDMCEVVIPL